MTILYMHNATDGDVHATAILSAAADQSLEAALQSAAAIIDLQWAALARSPKKQRPGSQLTRAPVHLLLCWGLQNLHGY